MANKLPDKLPALVRQPHGGALLGGGLPGHVGGGGRPSSVLRERLRGSFQDRVKVLEAIADDPEADPQDRIRAIDVLAKYGLGVTRELTVDEVRDRLRDTVVLLRRALPSEQATEILTLLREVWTR